MSTIAQPASGRFRIVDEPTTPKQKAIVEAIQENPNASNDTIADRVGERLGDDERPSASWVSRIRSTKLAEVDDVPDDVSWEDVDYRRMRQVAAVRNVEVERNPSKPDLVDALEADGVGPAVVASIPDDDVHDADAIQATVDNLAADDTYDVARHDADEDDTTDTTYEEPDRLYDRLDAIANDVEELAEAVDEANERLRKIERICEGEFTDDFVAEVLRNHADELTND